MFRAIIAPDYEAWHAQARSLLAAQVPPPQVVWGEQGAGQPLLGDLTDPIPPARRTRHTVPRTFVEAAKRAARHQSPGRWPLLYRLLWRIVHGERTLLDDDADEDVLALRSLLNDIRQDVERMKAFVRFRSIGPQGAERFVAWHRPDHDVAGLAAPHFADRYPNLRWSIFTPLASVHWDGRAIATGPGVPAGDLPNEDSNRAAEALWRAYYGAAFNPARANEAKLGRDMPYRFRATLPEAGSIPGLLAEAPARAQELRRTRGAPTARAQVPESRDLPALREAAKSCTGCDLFRHATQTVFGEGPPSASIVLVGEQPGDAEDRKGHPFVGPAGALLDRALAEAGIPRAEVYITNAVKHFAWEPRGKRRIHRTPRLSETRACRPWLEAELASLRPRVIVLLGGTAAQSLLGPQARVNALRGRVITDQSWAPSIVVTLHPAAVLRSSEPEAQEAAYASLVDDLRLAAEPAERGGKEQARGARRRSSGGEGHEGDDGQATRSRTPRLG